VAPNPLSRRSFLALTGGAVLLAACGGDDGGGKRAGADASDGTSDEHEHFGEESIDFTEVSAGIVSSDLHVSSDPQRFAFAVLAREGYASGAPARVALGAPDEEPGDFVAAELHAEGLPERRAVYTLMPVLATAGVWQGRLDYDGEISDFAFEVRPEPIAPAVGTQAIASPSPTVDDPLGSDPICTLDPPCPLHDRSLDELLRSGRPVVVQFSTPARCASEYCGPVLEALLTVVPEYEDAVEFHHVEIYRDRTSPDVAQAVRDWGLPSEPWLFAIDGDGVIRHRLDGAFDAGEIRSAVAAIAPGTATDRSP
jgi:hypothetical protein